MKTCYRVKEINYRRTSICFLQKPRKKSVIKYVYNILLCKNKQTKNELTHYIYMKVKNESGSACVHSNTATDDKKFMYTIDVVVVSVGLYRWSACRAEASDLSGRLGHRNYVHNCHNELKAQRHTPP